LACIIFKLWIYKSMLIIHPPVDKPSEPPAGPAKLAGALKHHHIRHFILDANLESLHHRIQHPGPDPDLWTRRAERRLSSHLEDLTNWTAFRNLDRYKRTVMDINRLVQTAGPQFDGTISLVNFTDHRLSPLRSADLIRAAENPEQNPFYDYFRSRLYDLLQDRQPTWIGLSLNYLSQAFCAFAMAGYIRKTAPDLKIILGGGLVSSWLSVPGWRNPFVGLIDELISGPGEHFLLSTQGVKPAEAHYRPDYEAFSGLRYLSPGNILPYSTSTGCFWNRCTFCPEHTEGHPYTPIPLDRVMTDLESLTKETKPVLIHFLDNTLSPAMLRRLGNNPLSAPWYGFTRFFKELTELDFCLALKHSGCRMLKLGLESGDQGILDQMEKGIDLGMASAALWNLKKAGLATYVYVLFGTPAEDHLRAWHTLEFLVQHHRAITFLNLAIFNLPSHCLDSVHLETEPFYEGDLSLYRQFRHPLGWQRNKVRQFLDREVKKHPAIAPILRRTPPFFTSNHAPFFCN
jgi:hypothetical protein